MSLFLRLFRSPLPAGAAVQPNVDGLVWTAAHLGHTSRSGGRTACIETQNAELSKAVAIDAEQQVSELGDSKSGWLCKTLLQEYQTAINV